MLPARTPPVGDGLAALLRPSSVAIVGLSADPSKHGSRVLGHLRRLGYGGEVWGVNPKGAGIEGVTTVRSIADLPEPPDVVVCAIPAPGLPMVVREAVERGAGAAVVFSGGFAESGSAGRAAQEELAGIARAGGMRLLGPSSGGVINPGARVALSFLTCLDRPAEE
ncbi:MAG: CoA-binding protein, partial [Acidimicrobiales bacterium]